MAGSAMTGRRIVTTLAITLLTAAIAATVVTLRFIRDLERDGTFM